MKPATIELGPYQLGERIGEGGNGQVFRARGPHGAVAIKILGPASDLDESARARFEREIATLGHLGHPNLVTMIDHGIDPELGPYLVLPLLAGTNLRAFSGLCPEAALLLVLPIAQATAALHAAGYVHRDLKPENVIAGPDGTITVIDLGLAWRDGMTHHTDTGAAVGSIGYMSPEQIEGRTVDDRADVWALGVMIYEWIAKVRPFARARPTEEAAAMLLGTCPRLSAADRRTGDELAELIARCLAVDPARRPSAAELVTAIEGMIDWTDAIAVERAAMVTDPIGYQARVAPFRVRRLERLAREALDAGKPFVALTWCDRGLAYAPDHPELLALVARAEEATAPATARHELAVDQGTAPTVRAQLPARRRRRWLWPVVAAIGIAVGGLAVYLIVPARTQVAAPPDPWNISRKNEPPGPPVQLFEDKDRALAHDFLSAFRTVVTTIETHDKVVADGQTPSTAAGWLEKAAKQEPVDAVASIRHALTLDPDSRDGLAGLCLALATSHDVGAVAACDTAIVRQPQNATLLAARGAAKLNAGNAADALVDLDAAVFRDPDAKWRRLRARARLATGDREGAKQDLEAACKVGDQKACALL